MRIPTIAVLLLGAVALSCGGDVAPDAPRTTSEDEIPGTTDPDDLDPITAQMYIDNVQVGTGLDMNGKVPADQRTDRFAPGDTVCLSMEVTDAPAGSRVRVTLFNEDTSEQVWSEEADVPAGQSYINFTVEADEMDPGPYRAEVIIGDEQVAVHSIELLEQAA
ncbi:MAG: hypothetical protein PVF68_12960 [Acidobacteriota bacterium]|jgi:hypothetical protein